MKVLVQRLSTNSQYARVLEWGKLVTITGGAQAFVQALGLLGGILVIRLLPTQEYALYTLANTMLGAMIILADGGISAGVLSQGGKVWDDEHKLGIVLATGLDLRKKFAVGSLLLATPVLLYLLRSHNASWLTAGLIIASLVPTFITALSGTLLEVAPKLRQDIAPMQKIQVGANLGRLSMLVLTLFTFPWAFMAMLASGLSQIWANKELRKISASYADWNQKTDPVIRREILVFVKRILPGSIYYCLSGQITTWLISFFGSTTAVAQVGALGRLAMMLSLFSVLFNTLVLPRFARLPTKAKLLLNRYLQIQALLILLSIIIIGIVWLFPSEILFILGKKYSNLETEVVLNIINSCLGLIAGVSFSICTSRGWAIHPLISIPITIAAIICGVFIFNIRSLIGILTLNIFVSSIEVIMYAVYSLLNMMRVKVSSTHQ